MQAQDRQEKERADARNALEEYVYELRGKLSEGEVLHDFVAEDQRQKLVNQLDALEQWLYDEGEDQNRQVIFDELLFIYIITICVYVDYRKRIGCKKTCYGL